MRFIQVIVTCYLLLLQSHGYVRRHAAHRWLHIQKSTLCLETSHFRFQWKLNARLTRRTKRNIIPSTGPAAVDNKKRKQERMSRPFVERVHRDADRLTVSDLKPGEKRRGRIISIVDYGLFVDVGAMKDGLVHIKDVSKDYFIQNLHTKFIPGQDIDVWVKFVNERDQKMGLQMYDPLLVEPAAPKNDLISIDDLSVKQKLKGKVVKFSDFGAFVDIGGQVTAFMHRRKMKSNRRQRKYMPWELLPLGSEIVCYVHEVDLERQRVSVTDYSPELWEARLPSVEEKRSESGYSSLGSADPMIEDDEELGGSTRAANLAALKRTLALTLDDDDEDDDYEDGESLEDAEDAEDALFNYIDDEDVAEQSKLVLDDFDDDTDTELVQRKKRNGASKFELLKLKMMQEEDDEEDLEEQFNLLANGRSHIYFKDVKSWGFVRMPIDAGVVQVDAIRKLYLDVKPEQGRIDYDQFIDFVGRFEELLDLGDGDLKDDSLLDDLARIDRGEYVDDDAQEEQNPDKVYTTDEGIEAAYQYKEEADMCLQHKENDQQQEQILLDDEVDDDNDDWNDDEEEEFVFIGDDSQSDDSAIVKGLENELVELTKVGSPGSQTAPDSEIILLRDLFVDLAQESDTQRGNQKSPDELFLTFKQLKEWDFVQSLGKRHESAPKLVKAAFDKCVTLDKNSVVGSELSESLMGIDGFQKFVELLGDLESDIRDFGEDRIYDLSELTGEEEDIEMSIEEAYDELLSFNSDPKEQGASLHALQDWPMMRGMLESGDLSVEKLQELFYEALEQHEKKDSERKAKTMSLAAFDTFLDLLEPYTASDNSSKGTVPPDNVDDDDGDEDDRELLRSVFNDISNGKDFVTAKDLLQWDLVFSLFGEGILDETILAERMEKMNPSDPQRLPIEAFDKFVDDMILLYADSGLQEEYDDESEQAAKELELDVGEHCDEVDSITANRSVGSVMMVGDDGDDDNLSGKGSNKSTLFERNDSNSEGYQGEDGDEEDFLEIDVDDAFERLRQQREFITLRDIQNWEVVQQTFAFENFEDEDWEDVLELAAVDDGERISVEEFEDILDILFERMESIEEE